MRHEDRGPILIDQMLFGYDGGHRLLAFSTKFGEQTIAQLLPLSDLAPGLSSSSTMPYWTGVPLQSEERYALLRTWLAPEMGRPGCVWTQVLLIRLGDLGRLVDLRALLGLAVRPIGGDKIGNYSKTLVVGWQERGETHGVMPKMVLRELLSAVYGDKSTVKSAAQKAEVDEVSVFLLWNQQWPELRQRFSFRTAGRAPVGQAFEFDLEPSLVSRSAVSTASTSESDAWLDLAVEDAIGPERSASRGFLWKYGHDGSDWRRTFRLLCSLNGKLTGKRLSGNLLESVLMEIEDAFPGEYDGRALKCDLVAHSTAGSQVVLDVDPLDLLVYFTQVGDATTFPVVSERVISDALARDAPRSRDRVLALAEAACERRLRLRVPLVNVLARELARDDFIAKTDGRPALRLALAATRAEFLEDPAIRSVPEAQLGELVGYVPVADKRLSRSVVSNLLSLNYVHVADTLTRLVPRTVLELVLGVGEQSSDQIIGSAWHSSISAEPRVLQASVLTGLSTSKLLALGQILGFDTPSVIDAGPVPWAAALQGAIDDTNRADRLLLYCFVLAVALAVPKSGCEAIFELAFEEVHQALAMGALKSKARSLLLRRLPELPWWENWDSCLRLRRGIVKSYLDGQLDRRSFARLLTSSAAGQALRSAAEELRAEGILY